MWDHLTENLTISKKVFVVLDSYSSFCSFGSLFCMHKNSSLLDSTFSVFMFFKTLKIPNCPLNLNTCIP